jgi:Cu2+-exporting ATPase
LLALIGVLASDDPRAVLGVITLSRASYRKMIQNLAWATGYNLISVPLAAGCSPRSGSSWHRRSERS